MADVTKDLLIRISTEGNADAAIVSAAASTDSFLGKMTGLNQAWELFNKLVGVAKNVITTAFDFAKPFVDTASTFEQLGIRFNTIFGGEGPAQQALDWAAKFAATTPLTLEQVAAAMLRLKAYGFDPMNGSLESIGNAAFALGGDFNGIVLALGQMELRGKVVQQELNQLTNQNIPAAKWLKEELGLTAAAMGDIGNQSVDASKAIEIILRKFDEHYGGALKKAGDSWKGAITTIEDTWMLFKRAVMDNGPFEFLVEKIKMVRDKFQDWFGSKSGQDFTKNIGQSVLNYLKAWDDTLTGYVNKSLKGTETSLLEIVNVLRIVLKTSNDLLSIFSGPIMTVLKATVSVVNLWATGFDVVWTKAGNILTGVKNIFMTIYDYSTKGALWFVDMWKSLVSSARIAMTEVNIMGNKFMLDWLSGKGAEMLSWLGVGTESISSAKSFFEKELATAEGRLKELQRVVVEDQQLMQGYETTRADYFSKGSKAVTTFADALALNKASGIPTLFSGELGLGASPDKQLYDAQNKAVVEGVLRGIYDGYDTSKPLTNKTDQMPKGYNVPDVGDDFLKKQGINITFGTGDGDELMNLIVNRLNKAVLASGTIGAGF